MLLGDPGGGKTTAAQVLMHDQAAQPNGRVPFIVTLREFAAADDTAVRCWSPPGQAGNLLSMPGASWHG